MHEAKLAMMRQRLKRQPKLTLPRQGNLLASQQKGFFAAITKLYLHTYGTT